MGPVKATERFLSEYDGYDSYTVTLYGSLAMTGEGHGTDKAIINAFGNRKVSVVFDKITKCVHPNTIDFEAVKEGAAPAKMQIFSIGGGEILVAGEKHVEGKDVYSHNTFQQIKEYCQKNKLSLEYKTVDRTGPDNKPLFRYAVYIDGKLEGQGVGASKKAAEQDAACKIVTKWRID